MKKKNRFHKPKSQIKKFKGPRFVWGELGHKAARCYQRKRNDSKQEGKVMSKIIFQRVIN